MNRRGYSIHQGSELRELVQAMERKQYFPKFNEQAEKILKRLDRLQAEFDELSSVEKEVFYAATTSCSYQRYITSKADRDLALAVCYTMINKISIKAAWVFLRFKNSIRAIELFLEECNNVRQQS